jgi:pyruvate kinase
MLSDETANGSYPLETVAAMRKVILFAQQNTVVPELRHEVFHMKNPQQDAISAAAVKLAEQLKVDAIVAETKSGATAANIATHRPNLPIISVTSDARTAQQLALTYASQSFVRPDGEKAGLDIAKELKADGYFGDTEKVTVAIVSGRQPGLAGATDTIRVRVLE